MTCRHSIIIYLEGVKVSGGGGLVQSRCRPEYMLTDSMLQALDQCEPQIIIKVANIVRFAVNIGLFFLAANDTVLLYMLMRSQ